MTTNQNLDLENKQETGSNDNQNQQATIPSINSFFAGIGGFDLGFERAGAQVKMQCEINKFCIKVLKKHWSQILLKEDITQLTPESIPDADVWTGGFPCQDVSLARGAQGRQGLKGKNSGLFYPFAELIRAKRPKVLLIENVEGLLSSHNGQDFRVILETLSGMGYFVAWRVMNSRYFGAPQSRARVFICASLDNPFIALNSLYEEVPGTTPPNQREGFLKASLCKKSGAAVPQVAYCLAATSGRHTGTDWSRTYISYKDMVRRLIPSECEGLQGFPTGWTEIKDNTLDIDTERYHALGNAVAVPVIEWIAQRMLNSLNFNQPGFGNIKELLSRYKDFEASKKTKLRMQKLSELHLTTDSKVHELKWQSGGFVAGDVCWDISAPEAPSELKTKLLIDVISKTIPDEKYFLSPNAAEGILRRVRSQNRTLFGPLDSALQELAVKNGVEVIN